MRERNCNGVQSARIHPFESAHLILFNEALEAFLGVLLFLAIIKRSHSHGHFDGDYLVHANLARFIEDTRLLLREKRGEKERERVRQWL